MTSRPICPARRRSSHSRWRAWNTGRWPASSRSDRPPPRPRCSPDRWTAPRLEHANGLSPPSGPASYRSHWIWRRTDPRRAFPGTCRLSPPNARRRPRPERGRRRSRLARWSGRRPRPPPRLAPGDSRRCASRWRREADDRFRMSPRRANYRVRRLAPKGWKAPRRPRAPAKPRRRSGRPRHTDPPPRRARSSRRTGFRRARLSRSPNRRTDRSAARRPASPAPGPRRTARPRAGRAPGSSDWPRRCPCAGTATRRAWFSTRRPGAPRRPAGRRHSWRWRKLPAPPAAAAWAPRR